MDGLKEHLQDPIGWAACVIADHFELGEDGYSASPEDIKIVVDQSLEYIAATFKEEGLDTPSADQIYQAAVEKLQSR